METKFSIKREWLLWLIMLSPLVLVIARWNEYPERIPIHWNVNGEVDNYGGKWALFLSPGINIILYLLMLVLPKLDPRKKNYDLFSGAYFVFRVSFIVLFCMIGFITELVSLGYKLDVGLLVQLGVIALFMILGNQFGRIRHNYFVGIRTPWTLNSEEVWTKTHRLAGKVWVIGSLLMLPGLFFFPMKVQATAFIVYIITITLIPTVYSYVIHKRINAQHSGK